MGTPARGSLRWLRSAALAAAAVGLAAAAHLLAGGDVPGLGALSVLTLLTCLVCVLVTGRQRGVVAITATMAALQLVLHEGFMLMAPMAADPGACGHVLSEHHGHTAGALQALCGDQLVATGDHLGTSPTMLLAHTGAVVLLSAALARGERALWLLRRLLVPRLPACPLPAAPHVTPSPSTAVVLRAPTASARSFSRRGPPATPSTVLV
jgi:hypothetical protein